MHLQPCDRCGAINKRTAKECHKCGSGFTLPAVTEAKVAPPSSDDPVSEPQAVYEIVSVEPVAPAIQPRRAWPVAASVLMLALMAVLVYSYFQGSATRVHPLAVLAPAPTLAAPVQAASASAGPNLNETLALDPPSAGGAMSARPVLKECPDAVATLGLCNPVTQ